MMTRETMTVAAEIVKLFPAKDWEGAEFSEAYMAEIVASPEFDTAMDYLVTVGLFASTLVERDGKLVAGIRVL